MASDVVVPEVGELGMDVTFVRWLKAAGEAVAVGDPLFEVDTDKSVMVVEAYAAGTLVDLLASEGDIVTPRQVIGRILAPGEPAAGSAAIEHSGPAALPRPPAPGEPSATLDLPAPADRSTGASTAQLRASPRARRVAAELGVELGSFAGSGPDGLITEADVQAAAASGRATSGAVAATPATPPPSASATAWSAKVVDRASRARRATAELTAASWRTIPHFYLSWRRSSRRGSRSPVPHPSCAPPRRARCCGTRSATSNGLATGWCHGSASTSGCSWTRRMACSSASFATRPTWTWRPWRRR
jgi:pyruvate dehydrogenase E2 component (dihydrolipoamide acetyltransferase)